MPHTLESVIAILLAKYINSKNEVFWLVDYEVILPACLPARLLTFKSPKLSFTSCMMFNKVENLNVHQFVHW